MENYRKNEECVCCRDCCENCRINKSIDRITIPIFYPIRECSLSSNMTLVEKVTPDKYLTLKNIKPEELSVVREALNILSRNDVYYFQRK